MSKATLPRPEQAHAEIVNSNVQGYLAQKGSRFLMSEVPL